MHQEYRPIAYSIAAGFCTLVIALATCCSSEHEMHHKAMDTCVVMGGDPIECGCAVFGYEVICREIK